MALAIVLPLLTLWWAHGVYRHFVRPPKGAGFDWGMTHGLHLFLGAVALLGIWLATWRMFASTVAEVFK